MNTENVNLFEQASRQKLRFKVNGLVSVEDLWDLSLAQLDTLAKDLRRQSRETEESFIEEKKSDSTLERRFEIVKHIITTRLAERQARADAKEREARRKVLIEALENKQTAELSAKSADEIRKELAELDK